ncbi:Hpt domain-containing protein [Duganella violaceipulchra]|uniref:HPt (Histidine-containing phosphotransfer) domain-containing protein n=1 Tax=Duganella violaceipulchra TaxID=2849652 RepID=A0AA41HAQ0_9BURK|nr:Hpt domain-containing protein [Duganella violaceicalia]MBV6323789.1 Hpt domain-containing protein [Duganella violaceicalia]MCP2007479.1 HPt (histidine-containing phosphotransfer) domain-containing protein [Duganella violaceicalia]
MTMPDDPAFRARLAALSEKFAATVPGTLERITQALAVCKASGADLPPDAHLYQLHELLHGVAGSAGTFGFVMFGQQARRIEHMVRGVLTDHTGWPAVIPEVEKLLIWASRDAQATTYA